MESENPTFQEEFSKESTTPIVGEFKDLDALTFNKYPGSKRKQCCTACTIATAFILLLLLLLGVAALTVITYIEVRQLQQQNEALKQAIAAIQEGDSGFNIAGLVTEISNNFSAAETSREQLQAIIQTNHDSFLARASQIENTVNTNQDRVSQIEMNMDTINIVNASGVVYVRWGEDSCRSGATLLYSGKMGGSDHRDTGGGVDRLCMPDDPDYSDSLTYSSGSQGYNYVYGVEYQFPVVAMAGYDIVCAVCTVTGHSRLLRIPGKSTCPPNWTREYYGYLMSERNIHVAQSTFECVDKEQASVPESSNIYEDGWFGHNEAHCSGLSCPPYNNHQELNCVVCST